MIPSEWLSEVLQHHGWLLGVVAVFVSGLALNLTPCVYPMIPVTLAFFSGQSSRSLSRTAWLALIYVTGISASYAALGMVAAMTGSLLGSWLQRPPVLLGVALVLFVLSLGMFGVYELRLPQGMMRRMGQASAGLGGAFVMGLVVGLVAAPCVGPFVLGLMLVVSRLADPALGFALFFIMGLGMGLPYVVLGIAASRAGRLPKAGEWLVWSKKALGLVVVGFALYILKPLLPPRAVLVAVSGLLLAAGVYLGWMERSAASSRVFLWIRRILGGLLVLAAVAVMRPAPQRGPSVAWQPYSAVALEQGLREGRPVVIDVYADWCLPCVEMDHVTFRHPQVVQALQDVVTLWVDATRGVSAEAEALFARHDVYGVPTVLLFDRTGAERTALRLLGFVNPEEFLRRLAQLH